MCPLSMSDESDQPKLDIDVLSLRNVENMYIYTAQCHCLRTAPAAIKRLRPIVIDSEHSNIHEDRRIAAVDNDLHLSLVARHRVIAGHERGMTFIPKVALDDVVVDRTVWRPRW